MKNVKTRLVLIALLLAGMAFLFLEPDSHVENEMRRASAE